MPPADGPARVGQQGVGHDVADQVDLLRPASLGEQAGHRVRGRGEQVVADPVGDDPVDLLGHRPVAAAQARLHVRQRDPELGGDQGAGQRRVDVADHDHHVGGQVGGERLEGRHHPAGLHRVGARARAEEVIGAAQAQVGEEHLAHRRVVVLAGVDQDDLGAPRLERVHDRLDLDEVGPGPRYADQPHESARTGSQSVSTFGPDSTRRQSST